MPTILAMDAGGTSTRAVILDLTGHCLGYGRAGTGNPTAAGIDYAVEQLTLAAGRAGAVVHGERSIGATTISLAGTESAAFAEQLGAGLKTFGFGTELNLQPDLLGTYFSGTIADDGCALIAGTGAVAGRVVAGNLEYTRDGVGWLLGDGGSGFWIGRRVARAVVAAIDGVGPATELTPAVLATFGLGESTGTLRGRPKSLIELMERLYGQRPTALAKLAPLAFAASDDPVARDILSGSATALAHLLAVTRGDSDAGPIVFGGSILAAGMRVVPEIFERILGEAAGGAELISVADGIVGAAVLGLRHAGVEVDDTIYARVCAGIARLSTNLEMT